MINQTDWFMRKTALLLIMFFASSSHATETAAVSTPAPMTRGYAATNYNRLKAELPYYQDAVNHPDKYPWPMIPATHTLLHVGIRGNIVLMLRQRLKTTHDLEAESSNSNVFDKDLARAVRVFQGRHGLKADGVVGDDTRNAMNVSPEMRTRQIELNMQRWAQLSQEMGDRFVLVNIPEFQLHVIDHNHDVLTMKIVVGRPTRQTPELTSEITRFELNPHWNVPHMIAQNDIIPKIIENGNYLNDNKIRIFNNQEENAYELSQSDVNWRDAKTNGFQYHFRQEPGIKNALGLVKFEFQNSHDVYLHDTPAKELFNKDTRDFSSGCIRLEKPFALVAYLAKDDSRIDSAKIRSTLISRKTTYFHVTDPIPIAIAYLTSWVDDAGAVHFMNDVYQRDSGTPPEQQQSNNEQDDSDQNN
jgi:murein L,D-transpeptidase YcbB/YkuD